MYIFHIFLNSSPRMMVQYAETGMNANLFLNLSLGILLIDYAVVWASVLQISYQQGTEHNFISIPTSNKHTDGQDLSLFLWLQDFNEYIYSKLNFWFLIKTICSVPAQCVFFFVCNFHTRYQALRYLWRNCEGKLLFTKLIRKQHCSYKKTIVCIHLNLHTMYISV